MPVPKPALWNRLITIITRVEDAVTARITAHLRDPSPTRRKQAQDLSYVKGLLAELDAQIPREVFPIISIAYDEGEHAALHVPGFDLFPAINDVSAIKRDAVNMLADNVTQRLGEAAQTIGRRTDDVFRRHGLRAAAARALSGEALPLAYDRDQLVRQLREKGIRSFEDRRGRQWQLSTYAEMVLKTTTSEAQQRAVINTMLSRGLDLVDVKHTNPHHPEDECTPYDGKTFSLTGGTTGFPTLDKIPPFHPNCDHFLMPSPKAFAARRDAEAKAA